MSKAGDQDVPSSPRGAAFYRSVTPVGLGEQYEDIWLVATLMAALARRGITVTEGSPATLVTAQGAHLGLQSLARQLRAVPRDTWDEVIEHHADDIAISQRDIATFPDVTDPGTPIFPKVIPGPTLAATGGRVPAYARPLGGDLYVVAAVRRPGRTLLLMADDALEQAGGWPQVLPRATENLRALGLPDLSVVTPADGYAGAFFVLESSDPFGASRLVILDELIAAITDGHPAPSGAIVAAPHRHLLLLHVVCDIGARAAIDAMSSICRTEYSSGTAPISPLLYYSDGKGGRLENVTVQQQGHPRICVGPGLAAALRAC